MSDVKNKLIKIAYENPELRGELLPVILKTASTPQQEIGKIDTQFRAMGFRPTGTGYKTYSEEQWEKLFTELNSARRKSNLKYLNQADQDNLKNLLIQRETLVEQVKSPGSQNVPNTTTEDKTPRKSIWDSFTTIPTYYGNEYNPNRKYPQEYPQLKQEHLYSLRKSIPYVTIKGKAVEGLNWTDDQIDQLFLKFGNAAGDGWTKGMAERAKTQILYSGVNFPDNFPEHYIPEDIKKKFKNPRLHSKYYINYFEVKMDLSNTSTPTFEIIGIGPHRAEIYPL
jgi:hypothetical protein